MTHRATSPRTLQVLAFGLGLALAGRGFARAEPPPPIDAPMSAPSLFISPCGQPFRAAAGQPYGLIAWFRQADRNGDGRIDRAEFRADAAAFFRVLDENADGVIDAFELQDYETKVAPEILGAYRAGPSRGRHAPKGPLGANADGAEVLGGASPYELLDVPEPVAEADVELSSRITLAQFLAAADRRFDQLDAKHLGYLTLAGLPRVPVQVADEKARKKAAKDAARANAQAAAKP